LLFRWALVGLATVMLGGACASSPSRAAVGNALPALLGPPPTLDAHDGSVVQDGGTYWIFGTAYDCGFGLHKVGTRWCGINAFSSTDLVDWVAAPQPIAPTDVWQQRCAPPRFGCFRPHVARSPVTGQWVMWVNTYDNPAGYRILLAPTPRGPWVETAQPTLKGGGTVLPSRGDQDVFVDSEGRGWIAYTLLEKGVPSGISVERLNPELTSGTGERVHLALGIVEAPSLYERNGRFYMTYSDPACPYCPAGTGLASAPTPLGPWVRERTLSAKSCDGQPAEVTHLRLAHGSIHLYVSDRWVKGSPNQSRARIWWEPMYFRENGLPLAPRCVRSTESENGAVLRS
jgi:beta-xylosidase